MLHNTAHTAHLVSLYVQADGPIVYRTGPHEDVTYFVVYYYRRHDTHILDVVLWKEGFALDRRL